MTDNDQNQQLSVNVPHSFDDLPVGKTNFAVPPAYLEEHDNTIKTSKSEQREMTTMQRVEKKLKSNVWKTRKQGFQELLEVMTNSPSQYSLVQSNTLTYISQPNHQLQEYALRAILMYLNSGHVLTIDQRQLLKTVLQKCLVVQKQVQLSRCANELVYYYMENGGEEGVLGCLKQGMENKNPRICMTSLNLLTMLLNNYGIRRLKRLEMFGKHLQGLSIQARPVAKQAQIELFKEMYRWMGESSMKQFKVHPEVKEEVMKFIGGYTLVAMQIKRGLRKSQKKVFMVNQDDEDNQQAIDVLIPFGVRWVDDTLSIQKWKQKKQVLQQFIKRTRVGTIVPRDVSHLITLIKRLLNDNNINLLQCGFKIMQNLSKGLKKHFGGVCRSVLGLVFGRLKDNKQMIVDETMQTLKSMCGSMSMEDMSEEIKIGLEDKAGNMRLQSLRFLGWGVGRKEKDGRMMNMVKMFLDRLVKLNEDSSQEVRKCALEVLCGLKKNYGMHFFGDKIRNLSQKKIEILQSCMGEEMVEKQISQCSVRLQMDDNMCEKKDREKEREKEKEKEKKRRGEERVIQSQVDTKRGNIALGQGYFCKSVEINREPQIIIHKPGLTFPQISHNNQPTRLAAYTSLTQKPIDIQTFQLIRNRAIRETNPIILKHIISIIKKVSGHSTIDLQTVQFLMFHDWKKCRQQLLQFIQHNRFSNSAMEYLNSCGVWTASCRKQTVGGVSVKFVLQQLYNLLPKMTSPLECGKMDAVDKALMVIQSVQKVGENQLVGTNGWSNESMTQLYNVIKCRITSQERILMQKYSQLAIQLLSKGFVSKTKGFRTLFLAVLHKLKDYPEQMGTILYTFILNQPVLSFSFFPGQLCSCGQLSQHLLEFLHRYNDQFLKHSDLKTFILPLLTIYSNSASRTKQLSEILLDQVIQLCGENVLQHEIRQNKINGIGVQGYLSKWNINRVKNEQHTKMQRIQMENDDPWPINVSSHHVLKLISNFVLMGQPFATLATPIGLGQQQLTLLARFDNGFLKQYSDLLLKWVFWRLQIDKVKDVQWVLNFATKVVLTVNDDLAEYEVVILLSGMLNCLRHSKQCLNTISEVTTVLTMIGKQLKQKSFRFWINCLTDTEIGQPPVQQILHILIACYAQLIPQQLVTLARISSVKMSVSFNAYLDKTFDEQLLCVYGFKNKQLGRISEQHFLSCSGGPQNTVEISPNEITYFCELFKKNSNELMNNLNELFSQLASQQIASTHLKIMYSVIIPFLNKQLPFLNPYTYFKQLLRGLIIAYNPTTNKDDIKMNITTCLLTMVRMLVFFLIDLDQARLQNKTQMMKLVNKILLVILENAPTKHILEVLFVLLESQIKCTKSSKLINLLPKCIGRVSKGGCFRNAAKQYIGYILEEIKKLLVGYAVQNDHQIVKSFKNMLVEILTYHAEEATQAVLGYVEKEAQSVMRKLLLEAYEQVVSKGLVPNKPVQALVVNKQAQFVQQLKTIKQMCKDNSHEEIGSILSRKELQTPCQQ